jgi:hypothetical protein
MFINELSLQLHHSHHGAGHPGNVSQLRPQP